MKTSSGWTTALLMGRTYLCYFKQDNHYIIIEITQELNSFEIVLEKAAPNLTDELYVRGKITFERHIAAGNNILKIRFKITSMENG